MRYRCVLVWVAIAACGAEHAMPGDSDGVPAFFGSPVVHFVGQGGVALYRLEDRNVDGDVNEIDEITEFGMTTDAGLGFVAIDEWSVVAGVRSVPPTIELLRDSNHDRIATENERSSWFSGAWPVSVDSVNLSGRYGDAIFALSEVGDQMDVFTLVDSNGDGDADDPGEVSLYATVSIAVSGGFDTMTIDGDGAIWFATPHELYEVVNGDPRLMLDQTTLTGLGFVSLANLATLSDGTVFVGGFGMRSGFVAVRDANGNGAIEPDELRRIWDAFEYGGPVLNVPLQVLADNSIISGMTRLVDADRSGDFAQLGETSIMRYDEFAVIENGQPEIPITEMSSVLVDGPTPMLPEGCPWLGGSWQMTSSSTCDRIPTVRGCQFHQDGCHFGYNCAGLIANGTLDGTTLTYNSNTCTATVEGLEFTGQCAIANVRCSHHFRHWSLVPPDERL